MTSQLLKVEKLQKHFPITGGILGGKVGQVNAVNSVSFEVNEGETLGIVGESGCGKSTTGRTLMRLIEPSGGKITFKGQNLTNLSKKDLKKARRDIQMIFQDPFASLNPRHTVEKILEEPLIVHKIGDKKERVERVRKMLEVVGLSSYHNKRYPHQFSGGQRQRIGIAKALMTNPKLIIADEPVSALDVSVQSQVLNLLKDLQNEFKLTYIFIAHDLGVVRHISNRVAVMFNGRIVELANSEMLYTKPLHPYTKKLLSAVPIPDPEYYQSNEILIEDNPLPEGFYIDGSWKNRESSSNELIELEKGHFVACKQIK